MQMAPPTSFGVRQMKIRVKSDADLEPTFKQLAKELVSLTIKYEERTAIIQ